MLSRKATRILARMASYHDPIQGWKWSWKKITAILEQVLGREGAKWTSYTRNCGCLFWLIWWLHEGSKGLPLSYLTWNTPLLSNYPGSTWWKHLQSAFNICRPSSTDWTNSGSKIFFLMPESSKSNPWIFSTNQQLHIQHLHWIYDYLHSIYNVLGIISNLEMTYCV